MSERKTCLTSLLSFKFTNKFSGIGIKTSERRNKYFLNKTYLLKVSQVCKTDRSNHAHTHIKATSSTVIALSIHVQRDRQSPDLGIHHKLTVAV